MREGKGSKLLLAGTKKYSRAMLDLEVGAGRMDGWMYGGGAAVKKLI